MKRDYYRKLRRMKERMAAAVDAQKGRENRRREARNWLSEDGGNIPYAVAYCADIFRKG